MSLSPDEYYRVIAKTQLVSSDLYCVYEDKLLLGKRLNSPAKNWLFTPGSRAFKNELLEQTCIRVAKEELGVDIKFSDCKMIGVFDHQYTDNFRDSKFGTHYVNVAYVCEFSPKQRESVRRDDQHSYFEWIPTKDVLHHRNIHPIVKHSFSRAVEMKLIPGFTTTLSGKSEE